MSLDRIHQVAERDLRDGLKDLGFDMSSGVCQFPNLIFSAYSVEHTDHNLRRSRRSSRTIWATTSVSTFMIRLATQEQRSLRVAIVLQLNRSYHSFRANLNSLTSFSSQWHLCSE
jgi:hypothetical protein